LTLLGLDLSSSTAHAIVVDEHGTELARATHHDSAVALREVLQGRTVDRLGIAMSESADGRASSTPATVLKAVGSSLAPRTISHGPAVALAEHWKGAGRDATHVVALSAADTIDAGIVVDGRLFSGAHGLAGAARWLALNPVEREDYRRLGCLEAEVGGPGIVRRLVWRIKSGDRTRALDRVGGNLANLTAAHVFEAARAGDGVATSVVRDTAKYIGMAIANLIAIVDPQIVVLGGAIADAGDLLLEPTRHEVSRRISPAANQHVAVVPALLGDASAALGAARAAMLAPQ
jgi:predicted NBD/HSP70 family sugar kinase